MFKTYQDVIGDVIQNVREHFLEDGVDETVLQELKSLWETKLAATKAVEEVKEVDKIIAVNNKAQKLQQQQQQNYLNQIAQQQNQVKQLVGQVPPNNHIPQGIAFPEWRRVPVQLTIPSPPGCGTGEQRVLGIEVPEVFLQGHHLKSILTGPIISATLNLPLDAATAFLQDQVNNAFLKHQQSTNFININMGVNPSIIQTDGCSLTKQDDQFCSRLTCQENSYKSDKSSLENHNDTRATPRHNLFEEILLKNEMNVKCKRKEKNNSKAKKKRDEQLGPFILSTTPSDQLESNLEDKLNDILNEEFFNNNILPNPQNESQSLVNKKHIIPLYESLPDCPRIYQGDGTHSSSDDDDLDDDDDDDNDNEDEDQLNDDIEEETQEAEEDEPLNSEDDVSDADGTEESFETDNVIVCQFDKITRARNRWKFHLKDGIMNLNGEDYVFQKANGDAEW